MKGNIINSRTFPPFILFYIVEFLRVNNFLTRWALSIIRHRSAGGVLKNLSDHNGHVKEERYQF